MTGGEVGPGPSLGRRAVWRAESAAYALFLKAFGGLSLDRASALGGRVLRAAGPLAGVHKVAERNLRIAFPDKDAEWRRATLDAMWDNIGRTFAETPHLHRLGCYEPGARIEVEGAERLDAVRESGRPAVFISGHFANWEVMAIAIVRRGVDCAITYRAANNPWFDAQIKSMRRAYGVDTLTPKAGPRGARALLEHLESGRSVALMNDQKFNQGIAAEFFGRPAMTAPGPVRLAMRAGAPLIPMSVRRARDADGAQARFVATVHAPIELARTGDRAANIHDTVRRVNGFIEDRIREAPADWFWVHRRYAKDMYRSAG